MSSDSEDIFFQNTLAELVSNVGSFGLLLCVDEGLFGSIEFAVESPKNQSRL